MKAHFRGFNLKVTWWDRITGAAYAKRLLVEKLADVDVMQKQLDQATSSMRTVRRQLDAALQDNEVLTDGLNALKPDVALAHEADLLDQITTLKEELRLALVREEQLRNANHTSRMNAPKLNRERVRTDVPNTERLQLPGRSGPMIKPERAVITGNYPTPASPDFSTLAFVAAAHIDTCESTRSTYTADSNSYGGADSGGSSDSSPGGGD